MKLKIFLLLISVVFFTSCIQFIYYLPRINDTFPPTDPDQVILVRGDIADDYIVIGPITAEVTYGFVSAEKSLINQAALVGADAVIHISTNENKDFFIRESITGVAVKLK